jgi:hypothetical protein
VPSDREPLWNWNLVSEEGSGTMIIVTLELFGELHGDSVSAL